MEQVKIFPQLSTFYATEGPISMLASGQHSPYPESNTHHANLCLENPS